MKPFISATQIDNARRCMRLWGWDKIAKIPRENKQAFALGSHVHKLLEDYYRDGKPIDPGEVWRFKPGSKIFYPGKVALGMLSDFPEDVQIEHRFEIESETMGCTYIGLIDVHWAEGDTVYIVDHKTSSDPQKWGKKEEDLAKDTQRILYSYSAFRLYPNAKKVVFALNYGSTAAKYSKNYYLEHPPQTFREVAADFDKYLIPTIKKMVEAKNNEKQNVLDLEFNSEACALFGGCDHVGRCNLTTKKRIGAIMGRNKSIAELLGNAEKKVDETPVDTGVNPPEAVEATPPETPAETKSAPKETPVEPKPAPKTKAPKITATGKAPKKATPEAENHEAVRLASVIYGIATASACTESTRNEAYEAYMQLLDCLD